MTDGTDKKLISVVTPCYNEAENVPLLYQRVKAAFVALEDRYRFEIIFIDNASTDDTVTQIKRLAAEDRRVKLIVNIRNFGHIRSPAYAFKQAFGDAVIALASDLEDPPELIPQFIARWEEGFKVVAGVKPASKEPWYLKWARERYYALLAQISDVGVVRNWTGFGLYDRVVVDQVRNISDPYPYMRGLISELGYPVAQIPFEKPVRMAGLSKNNFLTLYDMAMLGITTHSRAPIRLATLMGFILAAVSLAVSVIYLVLKLIFWDHFVLGQAPLIIGLFFFSSVQLIFLGVIGEYIGSIHTQILRRPLVIEAERVNFDE